MPVTTRSGKRLASSSSKKMSLANLPPGALNLIAKKLNARSIASLYMTAPKHVRNVLKPNLNTYRKISNLRSKIGFRGSVNTRTVNPAYIQIVRRLQQINKTPNNNYEMRNEYSTGYHSRRIQNVQNLLGRLVMTNVGRYRNGNSYYNFNKGSLVAVPRHGGGVYVTVAKGISKRPNGSLFFNLRKRRERQRRTRA
jgi:hypothetical protein